MSDKEIKDDTKKASHILIKVKSDSDKEGLSDKKQKQKLKKFKKKLKNPNKFDDIAKKNQWILLQLKSIILIKDKW